MTVPVPPTRPVTPVVFPRRAPGGGTAYVQPPERTQVQSGNRPFRQIPVGGTAYVDSLWSPREELAFQLRDFISGAQPMGFMDVMQLLDMIEAAGWTPAP
jgi:hypothetical protein